MEADLEGQFDTNDIHTYQFKDPQLYAKFLQYRLKHVRANWGLSKWMMQVILMIAALIEIFSNQLQNNENVVDCFGAIILILVLELTYQLINIDFVARYFGGLFVLLFCIYMAENAVSLGETRIFPGMLVGISFQFFVGF